MSTIRDFTMVACPFADVPRRLYERFGNGATVTLRLKLGELHFERDVQLKLRDKSGRAGYRVLDVSWEPKGGGPYPGFHGTLTIADEGVGWSRIDLDGEYTPPFGVFGAAFDATVGHRIAFVTTTELLAQIARALGPTYSSGTPAADAQRSSILRRSSSRTGFER